MRVFKTRSLATTAAKNNKFLMKGTPIKPSREMKIGEVVDVKKGPIIYSFKVLQIPKSRLGAKLVPDYVKEVTSAAELEKLDILNAKLMYNRAKGTGRPTKKDRRDIDGFTEGWDWEEWED